KARTPGERAAVGGTLPYMAPEHLRAFRDQTGGLDERCDVFSLGVILYELLTGRHPFPVRRGPARQSVPAMIGDREQPPPELRKWNPAVSPAAEAVVRKCLAPDPADRYQSAEQLREDIDRHLTHLPLRYGPNPSVAERVRKWGRRHPRLSSAATVGAAAAVLVLGVAAGAYAAWDRERTRAGAVAAAAAADHERAADLKALEVLADHRAGFAATRLHLLAQDRSVKRVDDGLGRLGGLLGRYEVPDDGGKAAEWLDTDPVRRLPPADRDRLRADVGEAFFLMAQLEYGRAAGATDPAERAARLGLAEQRVAAAERYAGEWLPRAVREQRAAVADLRGDAAAARRLRAEAAGVAPTARDEYLLGVQLAHQHEYRRAVGHLRRATQLDAANFSAWFARGSAHLHLGQPELALMCYGACVAIRDDSAPVWRNRGFALTRMRLFDQAGEDYDRAIALDPADPDAYILRSDVKFSLSDFAGAEADLTKALATGRAPVRAYFLRANVRHWRKDAAGAAADRAAGLALTPADPLSWVGRAEQRAAADPAGALADVGEALKLDPFLLDAFQMKAHLLTELRRPAEAVVVLDRAVGLYPDSAPARAGRGVLLARQGKREAAVRDAKDALLLDTRPPNVYQVACIYALTSKDQPDDRREALALMWSALRTGFGLDIVDADTDLDALRPDPEFRRLVEKAGELARGPRP
ncbi:MAG TPA: protein kinase, partial [Urbifossiella sp.]|nr:protein kinase [Urbifossiella sp.]